MRCARLGLAWKNSPHAAHFFVPRLFSDLSDPRNREQTDSLAQGITEARPRYQETESPAMCRVFRARHPLIRCPLLAESGP